MKRRHDTMRTCESNVCYNKKKKKKNCNNNNKTAEKYLFSSFHSVLLLHTKLKNKLTITLTRL